MTPNPAPTDSHSYPGGAENPGYRFTLTAWLVLFLGVICLGLLNYLGLWAKTMYPNL